MDDPLTATQCDSRYGYNDRVIRSPGNVVAYFNSEIIELCLSINISKEIAYLHCHKNGKQVNSLHFLV